MNDLDKRISELELELSRLRDKRRKKSGKTRLRTDEQKEYFLITNEEELELSSISGLAKDILNALPLQVFIKKAEVTSKGRQYVYVNNFVRDVLDWRLEDITSYFDSDAFFAGVKSDEWQEMIKEETETLELGKTREQERSWTAETETGKRSWRVNRVKEIPIFSNHSDKPVAFCAIAQDIEFDSYKSSHRKLRRVFRHEYSNLLTVVLGLIDEAMFDIRGLQTVGKHDDFGNIFKSLNFAKGYLQIATDIAEKFYIAFDQIDNQSSKTLEEIKVEIDDLFKPAPFNVNFKINQEVQSFSVKKPEVIVGVLIELIRNAVKHSDRNINDSDFPDENLEIPIRVWQEREYIVWEVSNRCKKLTGKLNFKRFSISEDSSEVKGGFGAAFIDDIVWRGFGKKAHEMIDFPEEPTSSGFVRVRLKQKQGKNLYAK